MRARALHVACQARVQIRASPGQTRIAEITNEPRWANSVSLLNFQALKPLRTATPQQNKPRARISQSLNNFFLNNSYFKLKYFLIMTDILRT